MSVRLQLFGTPSIADGREASSLPFERRNQLLAYLALKRAWVSRAELATMFWPEMDAKAASANLRKTLHRLQAVPYATGLEVEAGALRLQAPTDVQAFEALLREGRVAEALPLWRGELLAGYDDDGSEAWSSWLGYERDRLRASWRAAVLARLDQDIEPAEALALSTRLLEADPLDEAALRENLAWLARDGQAARARQVYRDFVAKLHAELGIAPAADLQALHDSLASATPKAPPSAIAAGDGFVGRSAELRQVATLLEQPDCRLLVLTGPGGVGKTRLARRAMDTLAGRFDDGAAWVELEGAATLAEAASRIAREIGAPLSNRKGVLEPAIEHLKGRSLLLALDNCESLAGEAGALEQLLRQCPGVRILATSRVRLGLALEHLLPLEGMPFPDAQDAEQFEAFDAVRLFVAAARRFQPGLAASAEAPSIIAICREVEGLPLALELAASWTRVMSCEAIATDLREGAELLRATDSAQPARHASIEVVFEHSWRLLGPAERDALSRLAVFRGGFTVEAARAVAGASLPVLGALADKSLLHRSGARLQMHPLVQTFAERRLEGEASEKTQRAHALHFHRLLAQRRHAVEDGDREALREIETELDNCRRAWRWAATHADRDSLARSLGAILAFFDLRLRHEEAYTLVRETIEAATGPELDPLLLATAAHLEYRLDRYAVAQATATRALELAGEGDHAARLQAFKVLGGCALRTGRYDDARRHYRHALRESPAHADPRNAAAMLDNLSLVEKWTGHYDESLKLALRSLAEHRRINDVAGIALCLNNLGDLHLMRGAPADARAPFTEALALCERHGLVGTLGSVLINFTEVELRCDDLEAARDRAVRAVEVVVATGNRAAIAWLRLLLAEIAMKSDDLPAARSELARVFETAIGLNNPGLLFTGLRTFAELLLAQREALAARRVLAFVASHANAGASQRQHAAARLAALPGDAANDRWTGPALESLAPRIIAEASTGHAALLKQLIQ